MSTDSTTAPVGATTLTIAEEWARLLAIHTEAAAADRAINAIYDAALAEGSEGDDFTKIEANWTATGEALHSARDNLLLAAAPDYRAVQWKLAQLFTEGDYHGDQYISAWHRKFTDAVMADLARIQTEFLEAWLSAYMADGGSATMEGNGSKVWLGHPTFELSPRYRRPEGDEPIEAHLSAWQDAHYYATMNARVDALKMFPGGTEAIKACMRDKGVQCIALPKEQAA